MIEIQPTAMWYCTCGFQNYVKFDKDLIDPIVAACRNNACTMIVHMDRKAAYSQFVERVGLDN